MRDFSWRYFTITGDIDAYLLYKSHQELETDEASGEELTVKMGSMAEAE